MCRLGARHDNYLRAPGEEGSMAKVQVLETPAQTQTAKDEATGCCIVGSGPAGAMLTLLLARRWVRVTLLEMHHDFDREFRGDTVHPSTIEILDQLGLAERVHELRNSKVSAPTLLTTRGPFTPFDLSRLKTRYPYILMVHQKDLLGLLTQEATRYPGFRLLMGANVTDLIREDGMVRGVRYQTDDGVHELRALLTVGADGRFSRVRHLPGIDPVRTSPPMDVLWFRLPHLNEDIDAPGGAFGGFARGHIVGGFDRKDYWQAAFVIVKGSYQSLRAEGIEGLRRHIVEIDPRLGEARGIAHRLASSLAPFSRVEPLPAVVRARLAADRRCGARHVAPRGSGNQLCGSGRRRGREPADQASA